MFSQKHYIEIAKLIRETKTTTKDEFFKELIKLFKREYERFSLQKFLKASELTL